MSATKKKIYIGCSLTYAPDSFVKEVEWLKNSLRDDFEVLDFLGLIGATPKEVFEWDTKCVRECDLFLAICDHPSLGLGYELGVAIELQKPILAVAAEHAKVSDLILGVTNQNFEFRRYRDTSEIEAFLRERISPTLSKISL